MDKLGITFCISLTAFEAKPKCNPQLTHTPRKALRRLQALFCGMKSSKVLDEKIVKKLVIVMLILSGIALVVNNL